MIEICEKEASLCRESIGDAVTWSLEYLYCTLALGSLKPSKVSQEMLESGSSDRQVGIVLRSLAYQEIVTNVIPSWVDDLPAKPEYDALKTSLKKILADFRDFVRIHERFAVTQRAEEVLSNAIDATYDIRVVKTIACTFGPLCDKLLVCIGGAKLYMEQAQAMKCRSDLVRAHEQYLAMGSGPSERAKADTQYRALSGLKIAFKTCELKMVGAGADRQAVYQASLEPIKATIDEDVAFNKQSLRDALGTRIEEPYQRGVKTAPKIIEVAGGSDAEGTVWSSELSADSTFEKVVETWRASGASIVSSKLLESVNEMTEMMGAYMRFCETFEPPWPMAPRTSGTIL